MTLYLYKAIYKLDNSVNSLKVKKLDVNNKNLIQFEACVTEGKE